MLGCTESKDTGMANMALTFKNLCAGEEGARCARKAMSGFATYAR